MHLALLAASLMILAQDPGDPLPIHDSATLAGRLDQLAAAPDCRVFPYGRSRAGTELLALEFQSSSAEPGQPAILVVAGLTSTQAWTSTLALRLAESLSGSPLLESTTVLIVPRANSDGAANRLAMPLGEQLATGAGRDNDADGRQGEDPWADLNGDGFVTWMRVPDPAGEWLEDPSDPRLLRKADPKEGEQGLWRLLPEGRDLDRDGEAGEDPAQDAEVDRNFAARWEEHADRAGRYPTDEPATLALCNLVVARKDIQVVLVIGEHDNLSTKLKPIADDAPASKRVPKAGLRQSDADRIERLAERWKNLTGLKEASDADTDSAGTFAAWSYEHRGLLTLCTRPFSVPAEEVGPAEKGAADGQDPASQEAATKPSEPAIKPSEQARKLSWLEAHGRPDAHLGWQAFEHPELGPVQIGGYRPYVQSEPLAHEVDGLAGSVATFLTELAPDLARVRFEDVQATDLGNGLLDLRATLVNAGWLPLRSEWGERTRTARLPLVSLGWPEGAALRAGRQEQLSSSLDGHGRQEFRWLVSGASADQITLSASSDHAGRTTITFSEEQ